MFETPPIARLVDQLPDRNLTTMMLRSLDIVAPGEWKNPTNFDTMVRNQSGETARIRQGVIRTIAEELYADPAEGYQKALWCYRTIDSADRFVAAASMANKIGQKINMLRFLKRLTPKSDTVQAVDLGLKLATEGLAYSFQHGRPTEGIVEFGRSLAGYGEENLLRLGTLVCVDGIVPLGPDFADYATDLLGKARVPDLTSNRIYRKLKDALPGRSDSSRLGVIRETWQSANSWLRDFAVTRDLTRDNIGRRLSRVIRIADDKMDYVGAFIDVSTKYYTHTGTQSVARKVIDHAIAEAPREFFKKPADFALREDFGDKALKQRQKSEKETMRRRQEQEREEMQRRHGHQRNHFEEGRWQESTFEGKARTRGARKGKPRRPARKGRS